MAKKKLQRDKAKNKLIPRHEKLKGDLVDENRSGDYELSEEFSRNSTLKMPPKKLKDKKK